MSSTLFVDAIEPNLSSGVHIAGHVIQVVHTSSNTQAAASSGTLLSLTGLATSITPKYATSKMLIDVSLALQLIGNNTGVKLIAYRNGSVIQNSINSWEMYQHLTSGTLGDQYSRPSWLLQDSPNSTSSVGYAFALSGYSGSGNWGINPSNSFTSFIRIMEIAQ